MEICLPSLYTLAEMMHARSPSAVARFDQIYASVILMEHQQKDNLLEGK